MEYSLSSAKLQDYLRATCIDQRGDESGTGAVPILGSTCKIFSNIFSGTKSLMGAHNHSGSEAFTVLPTAKHQMLTPTAMTNLNLPFLTLSILPHLLY